MAFLKTILFILLGYYLLKLLARIFAPKILSYAAKRTEAHFRETFGDNGQGRPKEERRVGDVIIEKRTTTKKTDSEKVGEYVDFEEID
jgi:hypothetical protein